MKAAAGRGNAAQDKKRAALDAEEQRRLHEELAKYIGCISGSDPHRSRRVSEIVKQRLRERYGR
jgi:hypothetical protein